ncbi:uncharacterized protein FFB20_13104 [Fusarium fujikuroi]|uniref:Uncharacterized protein n=1 Tax=Fusarium fujikuroi TaxID=5127 RepID=A0A9Q9UG76_FUSFU|nr:Uncharacterized protein LW94_281 [Fusarium fujikuroi]SCO08736.1 uncharacterized protein FFB20_13104 [Fusarium fujikuroi]SCO22734.1 uncharacterized protein FFE2_15429 [Fusarium fujikuroi]VTT79158.1 unnamed protein product [Fusarium fujikuroi]VTT81573.1 unnamed protein product [Fusarium fujikuroi]
MSLSPEQKTRLLARQVQRFHEYSAGTGRPNSKFIKGPDVKLAAALEPEFGFYKSGDTKATHESWPFYWQLNGKGRLLARDLEWFRYMGYKLLHNGKVDASDLPKASYEEPPKPNWEELYGPPASQHTELGLEAMGAETQNESWSRVNDKPKTRVTVFESRGQYNREYRPSQNLGDASEQGDLITLATDSAPINKALCDFEPLCLL